MVKDLAKEVLQFATLDCATTETFTCAKDIHRRRKTFYAWIGEDLFFLLQYIVSPIILHMLQKLKDIKDERRKLYIN